jgi:hypothetical protein
MNFAPIFLGELAANHPGVAGTNLEVCARLSGASSSKNIERRQRADDGEPAETAA